MNEHLVKFKNGSTWLIIDNMFLAKTIWMQDSFELYIIYPDESEALIESEEDIDRVLMDNTDEKIGIDITWYEKQ